MNDKTTCDRCERTIPRETANHVGPKSSAWLGIIMCADCYAAEQREVQK